VLCSATGVGGLDNVVIALADDVVEPPTDPASTFDTGDEGWTVAGGSFSRGASTAVAVSDGTVSATGFGEWYWLAPPEYRGDASAYYGGTLTFTLVSSLSGVCVEEHHLVILEGGGYTIYQDADVAPDVLGRRYELLLDETAEWKHTQSNVRVGRDEMLAVLGDVGQLKIRGWFACSATGTGTLDDVAMEVGP